jgi:hypothetical protein
VPDDSGDGYGRRGRNVTTRGASSNGDGGNDIGCGLKSVTAAGGDTAGFVNG